MLLFKPEHVDMILQGRKTQTRRIWKMRRAKAGSIHLAKTKMLSKDFFARLQVLGVRQERLGDISEEDAKAEGYFSRAGYLAAFAEINNQIACGDDFFEQVVYVVEFEVI